MKDVAHHLAHIQRKIVQSARKDEQKKGNLPSINNHQMVSNTEKFRTLK